ncbi:hypothetical protein PILCRDRAFT_389575 [Piloderma croceum F 1598]|uniref:Uncharacterized protein n=1 Tax=Piloderma croceum (strain F 1598) TaxID=765440 RepID=A0A0C3G214_PILCF|nr:hypothetical protein PILCRDRAFT_389575 [Piloderma croceum F 1598]
MGVGLWRNRTLKVRRWTGRCLERQHSETNDLASLAYPPCQVFHCRRASVCRWYIALLETSDLFAFFWRQRLGYITARTGPACCSTRASLASHSVFSASDCSVDARCTSCCAYHRVSPRPLLLFHPKAAPLRISLLTGKLCDIPDPSPPTCYRKYGGRIGI